MIKFLNDIRNAENPISNNRKIINTIALLFLGIVLGTFSKYLDFRQASLPSVLMAIDGALDAHNFLGRFAIWVLIALCISIYSNSAIRASINVFVFFVGIAGVEQTDLRMILEKRYLCFHSWEKIASEIFYDLRWLHRLHGRALESAGKVYDKIHSDH